MKKSILLWVIVLLTVPSHTQTTGKQEIDEALKIVVFDILHLAVNQDVSAIDEKYVHPEYGVYDVFRLGVADLFQRHEGISFAFPKKGYDGTMWPNFTELRKEDIEKELTVYNVAIDCSDVVWDKEGLFVTDTIEYPKVSRIIDHQETYDAIVHSEKDKQNTKFIETHSYRVVLTEADIVFYLTEIEERYYLTLFDRVTSDCSA